MLSYFFKKDLEKILSTDIERKSLSLKKKLETYREDVIIFKGNSNLAKTISWLLSKQKENGSWGNNNVALTSLIMLALKNVEQPINLWGLTANLNNTFSAAEEYLKKRFKENKYETALWDTSVAARALSSCGLNSREFLTTEIIPFLLQYNTLNVKPHHLAQRILALENNGIEIKTIQEAIDELKNYLFNSDWTKFSPYIISQCVEAFYLDQKDVIPDKYIHYLIKWLQNNSLDSANFINICSTLIAIKPQMNLEVEKKLRFTVSSFFGSNCFRYDGSWYYDEYITAYAILALARYEKEILIRAPKVELNYEITIYGDEILDIFKEYSHNETKNWIVHTICVLLGTILLTIFFVYSTYKNDMYAWMQWVFVTLGSFLLLFPFKELLDRILKK
jgi:hypothetical protein